MKLLPCFLKRLERVVLGELQPNALQYHFKIFTVQLKQTLIRTVSAFFLIICRSFEMKYSFKMWLNNNSWSDIFADFSKTPKNYEKMRQRFEDFFNMNMLNRKINPKINSIGTWGLPKVEFLSKITSFLPLKLWYANFIFPILSI